MFVVIWGRESSNVIVSKQRVHTTNVQSTPDRGLRSRRVVIQPTPRQDVQEKEDLRSDFLVRDKPV